MDDAELKEQERFDKRMAREKAERDTVTQLRADLTTAQLRITGLETMLCDSERALTAVTAERDGLRHNWHQSVQDGTATTVALATERAAHASLQRSWSGLVKVSDETLTALDATRTSLAAAEAWVKELEERNDQLSSHLAHIDGRFGDV